MLDLWSTNFRVVKKLAGTDRSFRLVVETSKGPRRIWCPKKAANLYRYREEGREIMEVAIQDWLAERLGLVEPVKKTAHRKSEIWRFPGEQRL